MSQIDGLDEHDVLAAAVTLLETEHLQTAYPLVVARWIEAGLPTEPSEGGIARAQLAEVAGVLRQTATDLESLVLLPSLHDEGRVVFGADLTIEVFEAGPRQREAVQAWARQLEAAGRAIEEYLGADDQ